MAVNTTYRAIQKLLAQQTAANNAEADPTKVAIAQPEASGYGVFGQNLGAAEQQLALDPAFGGGHLAALRAGAEGENADYDRRLAETQRLQMEAQKQALRYGIWKTTVENTPENQWENGMFTGGADGMTPTYDDTLGMVANSLANAGRTAEAHKGEAGATKDLYAAGIKPDPADVNNTQGNYITGERAKYGIFPNTINPNDAAAGTSADAAMLNARTNADKLAVQKATGFFDPKRNGGRGASDASGDGLSAKEITYRVTDPSTGNVVTIKGQRAYDKFTGKAKPLPTPRNNKTITFR